MARAARKPRGERKETQAAVRDRLLASGEYDAYLRLIESYKQCGIVTTSAKRRCRDVHFPPDGSGDRGVNGPVWDERGPPPKMRKKHVPGMREGELDDLEPVKGDGDEEEGASDTVVASGDPVDVDDDPGSVAGSNGCVVAGIGPGGSRSRSGGAMLAPMGAEIPVDVLKLMDSGNDLRRDMYWVYKHMDVSEVSIEMCPSAGAWSLLYDVRESSDARNEFRRSMSKLLPSRAELGGERDDDGRSTLERIKSILSR